MKSIIHKTQVNKNLLETPIRIVLFIMLIFPIVNQPVYSQQSDKKVLVLHSYHQQYKWTKDITKGIENALQGRATLHIQYMDTKRQFDETYWNLLAGIIAYKHGKWEYDAIITADNNALNFVRNYRDSIFKNIPVIFCGINFFSKKDTAGFSKITGVNERAEINKTIHLIKHLQPHVKNLIIVTDYTTTGLRLLQQLELIKQTSRHPFDSIHIMPNITMAQMEAKLRKLTFDWGVLYIPVFRDANNQFFTYQESAEKISNASPVPVYGIWDFSLGHGILGGYMIEGYAQGYNAGKMAKRVIEGESIEQIPILWQSPNHYKFDYEQLQKFNIDSDLLPENSKIINEPYSLYKHDRQLFWKILAVIAILLVLSIFLFIAVFNYRRLLRKLEQNHYYLRALLNVVGEGIIDIGLNKEIKNMNYVAEKLTGYTKAEATGKAVEDIFDTTPVKKADDKIAYYLLRSKNGKTYKISKSQNPVNSKTKESGYVIAFSDITKIIDNEERFSRLTENAKDLIYRIKIPEGQFEYVSPAAREILGYSPDELYQKPSLIRQFIPEQWKKYVFSRWLELKNGMITGTYELQIKNKAGNIKWVNQRSVLVYDNDGHPIAMEGIVTDISSQKEVEERLRNSNLALEEAKERAEESDQLKSAFLANIAHEIRTPMNGIIGFSELLRSKETTPMSQEKYINVIQRSSERMLNIIDDLVNIAQIESGQTRSHIAETDIDLLFTRIENHFKPLATKRDLKFTIEQLNKKTNKNLIKTDIYKLDYAIGRLIDNAIKYTQHGEVKVTYQLNANKLEVIVKDTGIGISEGNQQKIFERFVQADNSPFKAEEGTGLGLAITRSFIEMMGETIEVESTVGKGSTFEFFVPVTLVD